MNDNVAAPPPRTLATLNAGSIYATVGSAPWASLRRLPALERLCLSTPHADPRSCASLLSSMRPVLSK